MTTVADLLATIDRVVPLGAAAEWDPVGLQLGDPGRAVQSVGICHEVTAGVIAAASDLDVLVSYHPLLFRPTTRIVAGSSPYGRAYQLISAGVALIAVHTAFDVAEGGTADALALAVGIERCEPFGPLEEASSPPLGRVGALTGPERLEGLAARVVATLGTAHGRFSGDPERTVGRVAVLPGSGGDFVTSAALAGADVLVTGDVSHHRAIEAGDLGLAVIDAGHAPTERPGMAALVSLVSGQLPGLGIVDLTQHPTDPWKVA